MEIKKEFLKEAAQNNTSFFSTAEKALDEADKANREAVKATAAARIALDAELSRLDISPAEYESVMFAVMKLWKEAITEGKTAADLDTIWSFYEYAI